MASIVSGPIVIDDILKKLNPGNTGAIVTFIGTVREKSGDITATLKRKPYWTREDNIESQVLCSEILNRIKAEAPIWKKDIIDEKITRWHD